MSKELFVTSTPHETKLAVVEDDQLVEVFFERENEYTLAGSIYKGKVTRVLPGMQSAFVDIGLDRDAFLYVTDFLEEVETDDDLDAAPAPGPSGEGRERQGNERQGNDRQSSDRQSSDRQSSDRQSSDRQSSDRQSSDRPSGERSGRERQGSDRPGRGRGRGGRHSEQHRAAQSSGLRPQESEPSFPPADEPEVETENLEAAQSQGEEQSDQQLANDRLPRRWRGRRGRRRGRSVLNESKYAPQSEGGAEASGSEEEEVVERSAVSDEQEYPAHSAEPAAQEEQPPAPAAEAAPRERFTEERAQPAPRQESRERESRQPEKREERPRQPQRPQRILLPGESLAKYNPRAESTEKSQGSGASAEGRSQKPAPRPSTEVAVTPGSLSASHGVLAGESLAKYRNRPAPVAETAEDATPAQSAEPVREEPRRDRRPEPQVEKPRAQAREAANRHAEPAPPAEESAAAPSAETAHDSSSDLRAQASADRGAGGYNFSPGSGVIEEEEINEEEHDGDTFSENLDDVQYEELEEETLESDHRENEFIAAGEGLAAALMEIRDPAKTRPYAAEETVEEEEDDDEEEEAGEDFAGDGDEEEFDEAEVAAAGDEPDDDGQRAFLAPDADPDDPNYSGRAEMRGPQSTAGFQQKTTDRGADRSRRGGPRRGRPQRGGRPMRGGGGPRRNIMRGPMPQINDLLKEGQEILVQIAKEPMAKKGARITSHIALPGRFLVFMPTVNHTGVSRKIGSEEERQRLKRILISEKGQSHGGFIVRTAATGASEEDLRADIRFLINLWNEIKQRAETSKAPALIYHDLNLVERILRDQVTTTFSQIWVDSENEYERILRFASRFQPSLVRRVKLYTKETPLFEEFSVQEEINKALKSKVWLKSGGYIVINQTEALVAIDINTGKYVGKTARLEDTIVKTNIDAIKEIVRQIRLRDLGGIIVIDFIDMDERKNRQKVMQALEEALKSDRSPSKVLQFNDFGLVAITRKRVKQSLERTLGTQCTYCTGTGMIKSVATVCNELYVELRKMARHIDGHQITLRVNPEVGKALKETGGRWLTEMEELTKKTIIVKSDPAQHQEQFDIH